MVESVANIVKGGSKGYYEGMRKGGRVKGVDPEDRAPASLM